MNDFVKSKPPRERDIFHKHLLMSPYSNDIDMRYVLGTPSCHGDSLLSSTTELSHPFTQTYRLVL